MIFFKCARCPAVINGFDKNLKLWTENLDDAWLCPDPAHDEERAGWRTKGITVSDDAYAPSVGKKEADAFMQRIAKTHVDEAHAYLDQAELEHPARKRDEIGFNAPEDGSQERYRERRDERPWAAHTFWWVIHNVFSHPLIGFLPFKPFFRLHDWTSRRMHGVQ